jgi:hypothetical protein
LAKNNNNEKRKTMNNERNDKKEKNRPFHEIRFGSARAAIWKNKTAQGFTRHSATVSKLFFDQEANQWRDTGSFDAKDLPQLIRVATLAYDFLHSDAVKEPSGEEQEAAAG